MGKLYKVIQSEKTVCTGDQFKIREWLEEEIGKKLDFCPMLEEDVDTDETQIIFDLHSEFEYDLTDKDYETWMKLIGTENLNNKLLAFLDISVQVMEVC